MNLPANIVSSLQASKATQKSSTRQDNVSTKSTGEGHNATATLAQIIHPAVSRKAGSEVKVVAQPGNPSGTASELQQSWDALSALPSVQADGVRLNDLVVSGKAMALVPFTTKQASSSSSAGGGNSSKIAIPAGGPATPSTKTTDTGQPQAGADFALLGSSTVLGNVNVQLFAYNFSMDPHDPNPPPLAATAAALPAIYIAVANTDIPLSSVMPLLKGTQLDSVVLQSVMFMSSNQDNGFMPLGLTLQGTLSLSQTATSSFGNTASGLFGANQSTLQVAAYFGTDGNWSDGLSPQAFALRGVFDNIDVNVLGLFHVTQLGACIRTMRETYTGSNTVDWPVSFSFFGVLDFALPGSVTPVSLDFEVGYMESGDVYLSASSINSWNSAFGIPGLTIDVISLSCILPTSSAGDGVQVTLSAGLTIGTCVIQVDGWYSSCK